MISTLSKSNCWHQALVASAAKASPADSSHADFIVRPPCRLLSLRAKRSNPSSLAHHAAEIASACCARLAMTPELLHPQAELPDQRRPLLLFLVDVGGI